MEASKHSLTALIAAFCRAHHYAYDEPRVFEDPYAYRLLTAPELEIIEAIYIDGLTQLYPRLVESCPDRRTIIGCALRAGASAAWVLARARYVEDKLSEALLCRVSQYVIIGAGFDTFAFRRPELQAHLKVFEIDHPVTQTLKRQRLFEVGLLPPPNLHFAAADLERESLVKVLSQVGYESSAPAFFAWPGVTMYLTNNAIVETLRSIRRVATAGSQLVFDYIETEGAFPFFRLKGKHLL
jgi:methyltransferase (TIGR00027 family)